MEPKLEILLKTIVTAIVKHTPQPMIANIGNSATLTLQVDGCDMGRCVGKHGSTIWAIQSLFWYAGLAQIGYPYNVKLVDPLVKSTLPLAPMRLRANWNRGAIEKLAQEIILTCLPLHATVELREEGKTAATVQFKINKYLEGNMKEPSFAQAAAVLFRAAGLTHGVKLSVETLFE